MLIVLVIPSFINICVELTKSTIIMIKLFDDSTKTLLFQPIICEQRYILLSMLNDLFIKSYNSKVIIKNFNCN